MRHRRSAARVLAATMLAGCSRHTTQCYDAVGTVLSLDLPTTGDARTVLTVPTPFESQTCGELVTNVTVEVPDVWMLLDFGSPEPCFEWFDWFDFRIPAEEQRNRGCELAPEHCTIDDSGDRTLFSYTAPPSDTGDDGWCRDTSLDIEFAVAPSR